MTTDADVLRALDNELDFRQICECRCSVFADRHSTAEKCGKPATYYLEVHVFSRCQSAESKADPDVNDDGDRCIYMCRDCMESGIALAQAQLSRLPARAQCPPWPAAQGCGRPMATLDDYVPVRRPL